MEIISRNRNGLGRESRYWKNSFLWRTERKSTRSATKNAFYHGIPNTLEMTSGTCSCSDVYRSTGPWGDVSAGYWGKNPQIRQISILWILLYCRFSGAKLAPAVVSVSTVTVSSIRSIGFHNWWPKYMHELTDLKIFKNLTNGFNFNTPLLSCTCCLVWHCVGQGKPDAILKSWKAGIVHH